MTLRCVFGISFSAAIMTYCSLFISKALMQNKKDPTEMFVIALTKTVQWTHCTDCKLF